MFEQEKVSASLNVSSLMNFRFQAERATGGRANREVTIRPPFTALHLRIWTGRP